METFKIDTIRLAKPLKDNCYKLLLYTFLWKTCFKMLIILYNKYFNVQLPRRNVTVDSVF